MKTLILSPRYTSDSVALRAAALASGWDAERLVSWRPPAHLRELPEIEPVPYGEPLFAAVVADVLELALIEAALSWVAGIPHEFRKRNIEFATLAKARTLREPAFIKPADDKCFAADIYDSGTDLPPEENLEVLISEPVVWEAEFRCFALERKVVTSSVYSRNGTLAQAADGSWPASQAETSAALHFAQMVLEDVRVSFPPSAVLDVGLIKDRGWAVVESNACWGAGIYGCNPHCVLDTLSRACIKRGSLSDADRMWIVDRAA